MKLLNIAVCQFDSRFQFRCYQSLRLVHFGGANGKCGKLNVVKLLFIFYHGRVAMLLYIVKNAFYNGVDLSIFGLRPTYNVCPLGTVGISDNLHSPTISSFRWAKQEYLAHPILLIYR